MDSYENEIWKDVEGYEGKYSISNFGRVYTHNKKKIMKMTPSTQGYNEGYYQVTLCENGNKHTAFVHRLVAKAFIPNPNNLPQVNHKNGIKLDNYIDNLEWCDASYNTKHAYDNNFKGIQQTIEREVRMLFSYVLVIAIDKAGNKTYFSSTKEAMDFLNYSNTGVTWAIRHKTITRTGYRLYGFKNKDLQKFANGEPLPEVLEGIPWKDFIINSY